MPRRLCGNTVSCAAAGSPRAVSAAADPGTRAASTLCPPPNATPSRAGAADMDTQRLILFFVFGFSLLMLWDAWEKGHRPKPPAQVTSPAAVPSPAAKPGAITPAPAGAPAAARAADGSGPGAAATA